jgi:hypothetical protein
MLVAEVVDVVWGGVSTTTFTGGPLAEDDVAVSARGAAAWPEMHAVSPTIPAKIAAAAALDLMTTVGALRTER